MSRPRSAGRPNAGGNRAPAQRGVYVQTPKSDIFVALLGVALAAMFIGCILMFLVLNRYGFSRKVTLRSPATTPAFALADSASAKIEKIGTVRLS